MVFGVYSFVRISNAWQDFQMATIDIGRRKNSGIA